MKIKREMKSRNLFRINSFYLAILFIFLCGCTNTYDKNTYLKLQSVNSDSWNRKDTVKINLTDITNIGDKDLSVELRHENNYPYKNVGLEIISFSGDSILNRDTVNIIITDENDNWSGRGWGSLFEVSTPLNNSFNNQDSVVNVIKIVPFLRDPNINVINAVGILIK